MGSREGGDGTRKAVESGAAGIEGLAKALGKKDEKEAIIEAGQEEPEKKRQKTAGEEKKPTLLSGKREKEDGGRNVLRLSRDASGGKKKKKKDRKEKKKEKVSSESSSDTSTSSSLFHLAALPKGVERLHRLHEERPGAIANSTLRRFNVLLNQSMGRGAANVTEDLPPVARRYMNQIFLAKRPEATIGLRNLREMRTLTTVLDLMAGNQIIQAMDIHSVSEDQERGTVCEPGDLGPRKSVGASRSGRRTAGLFERGNEGGSSRTESRAAASEGSVATELVEQGLPPAGAPSQQEGRIRRKRRPTRGVKRRARREKAKERKERENGER